VTLNIVTPNNGPTSRVRAGSVASNASLTNILVLNRSFNGVPETLSPNDAVPLAESSFLPHETKSVDLAFTYHWGDGRSGALKTTAIVYTLAPVPEPGALSVFGAGLLALLGQGWRLRVHEKANLVHGTKRQFDG
jgi:hypothetical protein